MKMTGGFFLWLLGLEYFFMVRRHQRLVLVQFVALLAAYPVIEQGFREIDESRGVVC
ncbi:MAG: hypothetical protein ACPLF9_08285 [Methanothermobacter tenebrarum]